jgi:hypothetical protein
MSEIDWPKIEDLAEELAIWNTFREVHWGKGFPFAVSSQLAEFPRLAPAPARFDQVGRSAVDRSVASWNLARGASAKP